MQHEEREVGRVEVKVFRNVRTLLKTNKWFDANATSLHFCVEAAVASEQEV